MSNFVNLLMRKTPYDLKELSKIIAGSYADATNIDEFITKTSFSPSVIGYGSGTCPRRWVLAFRGAQFKQDFDSTSVDNMTAGTDAHRRIQENFGNSDLDIEVEKEIRSEDPPIHGFVDLIIHNFNSYNVVVEIKTTRSEAFEHRRAKNAGPEYQVLQLLIYLYLLEERFGILLYENKNDHRKLIIPIELTEENKARVESVLEWMRQVYGAYKQDVLPKKPFRSNSKICKQCPVRDWCYNQPEGDTEMEVLDY